MGQVNWSISLTAAGVIGWIYSLYKTLQTELTPLGTSIQPYLARVNDKLSCANLRAAFKNQPKIPVTMIVQMIFAMIVMMIVLMIVAIIVAMIVAMIVVMPYFPSTTVAHIFRCGIFLLYFT